MDYNKVCYPPFAVGSRVSRWTATHIHTIIFFLSVGCCLSWRCTVVRTDNPFCCSFCLLSSVDIRVVHIEPYYLFSGGIQLVLFNFQILRSFRLRTIIITITNLIKFEEKRFQFFPDDNEIRLQLMKSRIPVYYSLLLLFILIISSTLPFVWLLCGLQFFIVCILNN